MKMHCLILSALAAVPVTSVAWAQTLTASAETEAVASASTGSAVFTPGSGPAAGTEEYHVSSAQNRDPFYVDYARPGKSRDAGGISIIRFHDLDGTAPEGLEEDLKVMAFLLEKNLRRAFDQDGPAYKMGIPMLMNQGTHMVQGLYLEGFGALFTMKVNFPLLAPPAAPEKPKEPAGSTEWESAKQELYGQTDESGIGWSRGRAEGAVAYDEAQVASLKKELFQALKNASQIRALKGEDSIAIAIFGIGNANLPPENVKVVTGTRSSSASGGQSRSERQKITAGNFRYSTSGRTLTAYAPGANPATVMTLRVRKSDVDDFAKDKLSLEDFQKKAAWQTYAGNALDSGNAWNTISVLTAPGQAK